MKNYIKAAAGLLAVAAISTSLYAGVTVTGGVAPVADNWLGSPTIATGSALSATFSTGESFGTGQVLAQTFTVSSAFTLGGVSLYVGGAGGNLSMSLFDLGTSFVTGASPTSPYVPGVNLFGAGSGLSTTIGGQANSILQLDFTGADQVSLLATHVYAFQITSTDAAPGFWLRTGTAGDTYLPGNAYRNLTTINGNPAREWSMAVYSVVVPEPSVFAIGGLGLLALLAVRRGRRTA